MARRRFSRRTRAGTDQYWTRYRDASGKRRYLQAATEEDLVTLLAEAQREAKTAPRVTGNRDVTLAEFAESWLARVAAELKHGTARTYRIIMTAHILPTLGHLKMRDLTRQHVRQLEDSKRTSHAAKTIRLMRASLSSMLAQAVEDELLAVNVAASVKSGRGRRGAKVGEGATDSQRPFSEIEIERLLAAAANIEDRVLLMLLARTGMRPGEAIALKWSDVNFIDREALVARGIYRGVTDTTKGGRSRRVDLSRDLTKTLAALHAERERATLRKGWASVPETVFIDGRGRPFRDNAAVSYRFDRVMRRAGLSGHVCYDLRHSFASILLGRSVSLLYVSKQLGHAKPTTTLAHYAHHMPAASDKSYVDALDRPESGTDSGTNSMADGKNLRFIKVNRPEFADDR